LVFLTRYAHSPVEGHDIPVAEVPVSVPTELKVTVVPEIVPSNTPPVLRVAKHAVGEGHESEDRVSDVEPPEGQDEPSGLVLVKVSSSPVN
jgi:hypothetical protein